MAIFDFTKQKYKTISNQSLPGSKKKKIKREICINVVISHLIVLHRFK